VDDLWAGSDFQNPPRNDGGVALCGACRRSTRCRLGLTTEALDEDGIARTELTAGSDYEGGPGVAHGGWTAGVLDEILGHVPLLFGTLSVTKTLEVEFLRPVPIDRPLAASAWVERREPDRWHIAGEIALTSTGAVVARGKGIWVLRDRSHFDRYRAWLAEQDQAGE
jgi:acyl-coenzyme A thioesterase PaaI-like protein